MSWKPSAKSSEHLRAKLDDEFETVAKPQGLRRSSDARRAAEPAAAPDEWQRTSEQRVRAGARQTRADREGARDDVRDDDGADSDRTGRDRKEGGAQADGGKPERKGPSLKMRAVGYLSRREHARRIGPQAGASCRRSGRDRGGAGRAGKEGWLSTERFAQSLVHRRASRQGRRASCRSCASMAWTTARWPNCATSFGPPSTSARWRSGASASAKAGRPRGLCQAGALPGQPRLRAGCHPPHIGRRGRRRVDLAGESGQDRKRQAPNARSQAPGPKRQVSGHRRQAYCAQPLRP